jgi:RNA polymerase sigma-70 factor (ECF subfamily)
MERERFEDLYRAFAPLVLRRCLRLLGHEADAHDATQEVFVQLLVYEDRVTFENREATLRWLYRVSTNLCLKRLGRGRRVEVRDPARLPEVPLDCSVEGRLLSREALERVLAAVDEKARAVFVHAFLDGMTQEEIADVMGLSRRTVGTKLGALRAVALRLAAEPADA